MASVERSSSGTTVVVADTPAELELLRDSGDQVVLLEGFYSILDGVLLLPEGISEQGAQHVCRALEQAAVSHQQAQERRARFRVVRSE